MPVLEIKIGNTVQVITGVTENTIGETVLALAVINDVPQGAINGVNATFTSNRPFIPNTLEVIVNGLIQTRGMDYNTVGNNTIILFESPNAGENIILNYMVNT